MDTGDKSCTSFLQATRRLLTFESTSPAAEELLRTAVNLRAPHVPQLLRTAANLSAQHVPLVHSAAVRSLH